MRSVILATIKTLQAEATAVCKGVEMTHGNSSHFLTFELDSGERIYFQVSMKCFMLIVEGDRCLITYKSLTNSPKKKLKSFERIGKASTAQTVAKPTNRSQAQLNHQQTQQITHQTAYLEEGDEDYDDLEATAVISINQEEDMRPRSFRN